MTNFRKLKKKDEFLETSFKLNFKNQIQRNLQKFAYLW